MASGSTSIIGYKAGQNAWAGSIIRLGWHRDTSSGQWAHEEVIAIARDHWRILQGDECLLPGAAAYDCIAIDPLRADRVFLGRNGNLAYIDGLKVTSITIGGLAGGALSTDIDKVKAWDGGYSIKTGTGQIYANEPARDIAEEIAKLGHNGGPSLNAPPAFDGIMYWRNSSAQNIANNTATAVEWDTFKYDSRPDEHILEGPNNSRFRVPHGVTKARVAFESQWNETNATGQREAYIDKVGGTMQPVAMQTPNATGQTRVPCTTGWFEVKAGDYLTLVARQDSGGTRTHYANIQIEWGRAIGRAV